MRFEGVKHGRRDRVHVLPERASPAPPRQGLLTALHRGRGAQAIRRPRSSAVFLGSSGGWIVPSRPGRRGAAWGKLSVTSVPWRGVLLTVTSAPTMSSICRAAHRPSPTPFFSGLVVKNG